MKKILIIQTASIGDVILATPIIEKLHHHFPEADIDFLLKKGNESLFRNHPFLHELIIWDKKNGKYLNFDKILHTVWFTHYDLVINLQRFFLTGVMTAFSRAGMKIGFDKNPLSFLFTKKIPHHIGQGEHEVDRNLLLIKDFTDSSRFLPKLYPSPEDEQAVQSFQHGIYYTISPASLWFTKQYPVEKWKSLLIRIPNDRTVYLLGGQADFILCEELKCSGGHLHTVNLAGRLTFLQSAALMKEARMNFTNDSAPMHLASSVNAPLTAIFCSTVPRFGFGPLSENSIIAEIQERLACRPCGLHGFQKCPEKHFKCALEIPDELLSNRL
ncbi:MAG: glycosyltransferase family 9 protein [Bacteroidales bacterium]|nr:glycosyltransferase family 9 protein [Bacteroidales bacterium]